MTLPVRNYCRTSCFPIAKRNKGEWFLKNVERIGENSAYGEVFQVCRQNIDCKYVLKCIEGDIDEIKNEVNMQKECAKAGLCMPVADWWLCNDRKGGAIITGLLQETLYNKIKYIPLDEGKILLDRAVNLILKLHENDMAHGDSHINNFMLNRDDDLFFIDLGKAKQLSDNPEKRLHQILSDYDNLRSSLVMSISKLPRGYAAYSDSIHGILGPMMVFFNKNKTGNKNKNIELLGEIERYVIQKFISSHIPMEVTVEEEIPTEMSWEETI